MFCVKNIVEHIVNVTVGSEDSLKICLQEEQCKWFPSAWMKAKRNTLPKAPFSLMKDEISLADERANSICIPTGFGWQPGAMFGKSSGIKSANTTVYLKIPVH